MNRNKPLLWRLKIRRELVKFDKEQLTFIKDECAKLLQLNARYLKEKGDKCKKVVK